MIIIHIFILYNFLELNGFVRQYGVLYSHIGLQIFIRIECEHYEMIRLGGDIIGRYDSEQLISKLKEILDIESRNKPIINK